MYCFRSIIKVLITVSVPTDTCHVHSSGFIQAFFLIAKNGLKNNTREPIGFRY